MVADVPEAHVSLMVFTVSADTQVVLFATSEMLGEVSVCVWTSHIP